MRAALIVSLFLGTILNSQAQIASEGDTIRFNLMDDSLEYAILKEFYESTNGDTWTNNANWLKGKSSSDFARWYGITVKDGDVSSIQLNNNNLNGKFSRRIYDLVYLTELSLKDNPITENQKGFQPIPTKTLEPSKEENEASGKTLRTRATIAPSQLKFARTLGVPEPNRKTDMPEWPLAVGSGNAQIINWRDNPINISEIPNTAPSEIGPTSGAYNNCGKLVFYAIHTGLKNENQLQLIDADGIKLTLPNQGLDAAEINNEVQVVKVPGFENEWMIIYSKFVYKSTPECGSYTYDDRGYYCPATILYSRVYYNELTKEFRFIQKDQVIHSSYKYTHGKALSRDVSGFNSSHHLYLVRRTFGSNDVYIDQYVVDENGITLRKSSSKIYAKWWILTIAGSGIELSPDESKLAIINRNQERGWQDIILFNVADLDSQIANPKVITMSDLVLQPDGNLLTEAKTIKEAYLDPDSELKFLQHLERKIDGLEFSPSGDYLYFTGGGYSGGHPYHTYVGQIDLAGEEDALPVRLQVQEGVGVNASGESNELIDERWNRIYVIESSYDGNLYFTKRSNHFLYVIPSPDDPMPQMLAPSSVNFASNEHKNISMLNNAHVGILPENIDGLDYLRGIPLPESNFELSSPMVEATKLVSIQLSNYDPTVEYTINWNVDQNESEIVESQTTSHKYEESGTFLIEVVAINSYGCVTRSKKSIFVEEFDNTICEECIPSFSPRPGQRYVLSAWVKESANLNKVTYTQSTIALAFRDAGETLTLRPKGAIIDGWQRIEEAFIVPEAASAITVNLVNEGSGEAYFDDIRIHPFNANMKSFVYDPVSMRLMAELDENNYATFYEYDEEGALIRVKKETERGVKTIQESRNHTVKKK